MKFTIIATLVVLALAHGRTFKRPLNSIMEVVCWVFHVLFFILTCRKPCTGGFWSWEDHPVLWAAKDQDDWGAEFDGQQPGTDEPSSVSSERQQQCREIFCKLSSLTYFVKYVYICGSAITPLWPHRTFLEDKKAQLEPLAAQIQEQLNTAAASIESQVVPLATSMQAQMQPLIDKFQQQMETLLKQLNKPADAITNWTSCAFQCVITTMDQNLKAHQQPNMCFSA